VPRLPTAVLAAGLVIMGVLSMAVGLVLDSIAKGRLEAKCLAYLYQAAPYQGDEA